MLTGSVGVRGGGLAHYVGQEKLAPMAPWSAIAFAGDWLKPPRLQNAPSFHYVHSDQWRYERGFGEYHPVPDDDLAKGHAIDHQVRAVRLGWLPFFPQFNRNSLDLAREAMEAGATTDEEIAQHVAQQLRSRDLQFSVEDPDAPENWPRVWYIWRGNALMSSAKGHEYFLRHYLGTHDNAIGDEVAEGTTSEVEYAKEAPRGKFDLVVDLNFRMDTSALYSDIVLPAATWYEKDDLNSTDLHSFIHPLTAAIPPCWESRSDWDIFKALAKKTGELAKTHMPDPVKDVVAIPAWRHEAAKLQIVGFVERATTPGGPGWVPPAERIAVFDNDGTLWSEQPLYFQLFFALDRVKALAPEHPEWKEQQPFKAALEGDMKTVMAGGKKAIVELIMATHAGNTTDEFESIVAEWAEAARHPKTGRPYTEMVYQPMLELLAYLRANGFKTWIVSGGGVEFIRAWSERVYGIPPEQVIGSSIKVEFELREGGPALVRKAEVDFIDDKAGKPVGIHKYIGRRPVLAFGNSDGDLQMLKWTAAGEGPSLMGIVHHTDAEREWAYDRESHIGKLDTALDEARTRGWLLVDMARDWDTVHPPTGK